MGTKQKSISTFLTNDEDDDSNSYFLNVKIKLTSKLKRKEALNDG
jgi:hypothetical protein